MHCGMTVSNVPPLPEWGTLKHLQGAEERGISVKEECTKRRGLAVQDLYNGKFQLVQKGAMAGRAQAAARRICARGTSGTGRRGGQISASSQLIRLVAPLR
jgi:hypothetical protein